MLPGATTSIPAGRGSRPSLARQADAAQGSLGSSHPRFLRGCISDGRGCWAWSPRLEPQTLRACSRLRRIATVTRASFSDEMSWLR
jgi:hypothetical protein